MEVRNQRFGLFFLSICFYLLFNSTSTVFAYSLVGNIQNSPAFFSRQSKLILCNKSKTKATADLEGRAFASFEDLSQENKYTAISDSIVPNFAKDLGEAARREVNNKIDAINKDYKEGIVREDSHLVASKVAPLLKEVKVPILSDEERKKSIHPLDLIAHGRHITLDYIGFRTDAREGSKIVLDLMREAVKLSGMREMHNHMTVLGENGDTPPGFTGVVLIDESHITAHCYSDRGWLAIDVFTCGKTNPAKLVKYIHSNLQNHFPKLNLIKKVTLPRFLHNDLSKDKE